MGLFDLFRPKWKHSDVDVRAEAVRNLDDNETLVRVARDDADARVRRIAVKRIDDAAVLEDIAARDADAGIRELASGKAAELWVAAAISGKAPALERLKNERDLADVARRAPSDEIRKNALLRITDDRVLADLARRADAGADLRQAALPRIRDAAVLKELALADDKSLALAAVARIDDPAALDEIARSARAKAARQAARDRLPASAAAPDAPRPAPGGARVVDKTRRARLMQLVVAAEAAASRSDWQAAAAELDDLRARFAEIESAPGDEPLEKRFEEAARRFAARRAADAQARQRAAEEAARKAAAAKAARATTAPAPPPAPAPAPVPAAPPPPPSAPSTSDRLLALVLEAEKLAHGAKVSEPRVAELEARWAAADDPAVDAGDARDRWTKATQMIRARIADEKALRAARSAEARAKLEKAVADVERQLRGSSIKGAEAALRNAGVALKAPGGGADEEPLRKQLREAVDQLDARLAELREAEGWKRFAAVPALEELCKEAEALAEVLNDVEDKSRAPALLKDLQARWKAVGPAPSDKHDALWMRFKAASDAVYAKCKEHFAKLDEERGANLTRKQALCAEVEALADSSDWKATADKIKALQEEWKKIGPVPQDQADAVWKRFRAACDRFFERRKTEDRSRDAERAANLERKLELCARVEALAASTDWKEGAALIKATQEQWQQIGPVPRAEGDAAWKRFRAACDAFFDRRKAAFAQLDEERQANLGRKQLLCERAEALADAEDHEEAMAAVKALQAEWKTVGPVPREQSDEIWRRFRAACDVVYAGPSQEELPPAAPAGDGSGVSGFANRLPLEGLVAKLAAAQAEKKP
jgi:hypothetical protein